MEISATGPGTNFGRGIPWLKSIENMPSLTYRKTIIICNTKSGGGIYGESNKVFKVEEASYFLIYDWNKTFNERNQIIYL